MLARKLKLVLRPQTGSLFLKAALFAVLLGLVQYAHTWWLALAAYAVFLYATHFRNQHSTLLVTYALFFVITGVIAGSLAASWLSVVAFILMGAMLFILLGVRTLWFKETRMPISIFFYLTSFIATAYLLAGMWQPGSWWRVPALFVVFYFLLKEHMRFVIGSFNHRYRLYAVAIAFIATQAALVASLLSVGYLNTASLVLILLIAMVDGGINFLTGGLNKKSLQETAAFVGVFTLVVLVLPLIA